MKNILICADCSDPFCANCDEPAHCPECKDALCPECFDLAGPHRQNRCLACDAGNLTGVQYSYPGGRVMDRRYTTVRQGKLPCD